MAGHAITTWEAQPPRKRWSTTARRHTSTITGTPPTPTPDPTSAVLSQKANPEDQYGLARGLIGRSVSV